jgi:UDP-N-acetylmuramate--alanine ligase
MHIYFSGIGGSGTGPLALVAKQAGYKVSGSDQQDSNYVSFLKSQGITNIHIGQDESAIAAIHNEHPIDWFVYSSAVPQTHPELQYCHDQAIKTSKRDELLNQILQDKKLKMIAIAGTHGKTTTTAMMIWLMQQINHPISYLLPAKTSFANMGAYNQDSDYFIYEADEYDRNFLSYEPYFSTITGIDWDHPDIYPTREDYNAAFREFLEQSEQVVMWQVDADRLGLNNTDNIILLDEASPDITTNMHLAGAVNRLNAWQVVQTVHAITNLPIDVLVEHVNRFPGVSRRFEQIIPGLYSDYAHTVPKIRGALQLGHEVADDNLVVVYEGLHNTRQHFIKDDLATLFETVKNLYIVPSYLAREDASLVLLSPEDLKALMHPAIQDRTSAAELNDKLQATIRKHLDGGDTVLCLTAGGGKSLDEWLRHEFKAS